MSACTMTLWNNFIRAMHELIRPNDFVPLSTSDNMLKKLLWIIRKLLKNGSIDWDRDRHRTSSEKSKRVFCPPFISGGTVRKSINISSFLSGLNQK